MTLQKLLAEFEQKRNPKKAKLLSGFFKTGKGEYGEGDVFFGLTVPEQRILAKKYKDLELKDIQKLIDSKIHEHRLTGLIILTYKYEDLEKSSPPGRSHRNKTTAKTESSKIKVKHQGELDQDVGEDKDFQKKTIFDFYLKNTKKINNWDLVDVTAPRIVGKYLHNKNRKILYSLARSSNLWEKRIAIVSTYWFIRNHEFQDTINISEILLKDKHDLIHKAVGWMLREMGKKDENVLKEFLDEHHKHLPRTMLRYAIERLDEKDKKKYMNK